MTPGEVACRGLGPLVTTKEAAAVLSVCVKTVRRLYETGKIRRQRTGHRTLRIPRDDLVRLIDSGSTSPSSRRRGRPRKRGVA